MSGRETSSKKFPVPSDPVPVIAAFVLTLLTGILLQFPYMNGPWYWQWRWLDLGLSRTLVLLLPGAALIALGLRGFPSGGRLARPVFAVACFTAAALVLQVLGILAHPKGFLMIRDIVISPIVTSYYNDAQKVSQVTEWLSRFHTLDLQLHSSTHPPGCILYYWIWTALVGADAAVYVGALTLALLASLGVPVAYRFAGLWKSPPDTKLLAASLYASMPALTVFFPAFDQVYPLITMGVALAWFRGLEGNGPCAVLAGLLLGIGSFFAYNLLTLGVFLAFAAASAILRHCSLGTVLRACAMGVLGFVVPIGLLAVCTGFNPTASLAHALDTQTGYAAGMDRPWLACVLFDPYDFVLGSGFVVLALAVLTARRDAPWRSPSFGSVLTALGFATVITVNLTGLLRAETARVWIFLQPFVIVPAALAAESLPFSGRMNVLFLHWLTVAVLRCKMGFVLA